MKALPALRPEGTATSRRRLGVSRTLVLVVVAVGALGVGAAIALPGLIGGGDEEPVLAPHVAVATPVPARAPSPAGDAGTTPIVETVEPPAVQTSADGDLAVDLKLRWAKVVSGATLEGRVRFVNTSLAAFQIPAAGEPQPTLALVVLDAEGRQVRRVVESGPDPYPRRTRTLESGGILVRPVTIVSGDDEPLPPGEYSVYAEFRSDPSWSRLGLPMWSAPRGPVRSLQEPVVVLPRGE